MKIYILGNLLVDEDSLPVKLIPKLKKALPGHEFIELDPSEDFPKQKELTMIDTVINAKEVSLITDIDKIQLDNVCSLHDFDLGYNLKLMKKFGMIEKVNIIGIPPETGEEKAVIEIIKILSKLT
ncbi:hypothetical protein JXC34_00680 [Candidatus Woesearchaeota archaeon]|nr:hypothetical protein [Candidatus Woesearchaeota archaeon]